MCSRGGEEGKKEVSAEWRKKNGMGAEGGLVYVE
jgi:hypothetical protein